MLDQLFRMRDQCGHLDRPTVKVDSAARQLSDVEQIADHPRHVLELATHDVVGMADHVGGRGWLLQDLQGIAERGQGIAQLVRQHGQELVLAPIGRREVLDARGQRLFHLLQTVHIDEHQHHALYPVLQGLIRPEAQRRYQRPCASRSSCSFPLPVSTTSANICSRSGRSTLSVMSVMGRPTSAEIRLNSFSAMGVNRRIRRSAPSITIGSWTLASRLTKSLLLWPRSRLRFFSSSLTVASSSLLDWISSF